jgi:hypothetical protein
MYLYKGARGAKCTRLGAAKAWWGDAEESANIRKLHVRHNTKRCPRGSSDRGERVV